ncbi:MAG: hypothetical protein ACOCP2_00850 [Halohasta sp.]
MAPDTHQQVDELLAGLASALDAEQSTGDVETPARDELAELAERADDLLSSSDLAAVAAATGLADEDDPPSSVPEAIATGEPRDVAALRSLLTLRKLSTANADRADELVSELASLAETARLPPAEAAPSDAGVTADAAATMGAEATADTEAADTVDASDGAEPMDEELDDEESDDKESSLRELLQSQFEETRTLFDQLPELDGLTEEFEGDDTDAEPGTGDDDTEPGTETADEAAADQSTRSQDGTRWRPGGGTQRTTHSTIPSTGRRDIGRRPGRFSSARGSTVSKR